MICKLCSNKVYATDTVCSNCRVSLNPNKTTKQSGNNASVKYEVECLFNNCKVIFDYMPEGNIVCEECGKSLSEGDYLVRPIKNQVEYPQLHLIDLCDKYEHAICIDKARGIIGRQGDFDSTYLTQKKYTYIARKHCEIWYDESWYIKPINSKNLTLLNQSEILPNQYRVLSNGDIIHLGKTRFKVTIGGLRVED